MKKYQHFIKFTLFISIVILPAIIPAAAQELGDVNNDTSIDIIDALLVAQHSVGLDPQPFYGSAADVDGSGTVNIVDALIIARFYVGLITEFPARPVTSPPAPTPTPVPPHIDYLEIIQRWAADQDFNLSYYRVERIGSSAAETMLPGYVFFSLILPQYPVMPMPVEEIGVTAIIAINSSLQIELIPDEKSLERFYQVNQIPAADTKSLVTAMQAWLELTHIYKNDGYYTFSVPIDQITVTEISFSQSAAEARYEVTGIVRVESGGEGGIFVTAYFSAGGMLLSLKEVEELIPYMRPICQSTKLLDNDLLVRRMAEQDLLAIGINAKEYLFSQRTKAGPALKQAIDNIWQQILEQEQRIQRIERMLASPCE